jgi:hypothetical protein
MTTITGRPLVIVWPADTDGPLVDVFDPGDFARWSEMNQLTGDFPFPVAFFGIDATAGLVALRHSCDVGPYDGDDFAAVVHTWTRTGTSEVCATGVARRDGRA